MPTKADYLAEFDALGVNPPAAAKHEGPHRTLGPSEASKDELRRTLVEIKRNMGTLPQAAVDAEIDAREAYAQRISDLQTAMKRGDITRDERDEKGAALDDELHQALDQLEPIEGSAA